MILRGSMGNLKALPDLCTKCASDNSPRIPFKQLNSHFHAQLDVAETGKEVLDILKSCQCQCAGNYMPPSLCEVISILFLEPDE